MFAEKGVELEGGDEGVGFLEVGRVGGAEAEGELVVGWGAHEHDFDFVDLGGVEGGG